MKKFNQFLQFMFVVTFMFISGCADHGGTETVVTKGDQGEPGTDGEKGDPGEPGTNGEDGKDTLVNTTSVAPSLDCPNGGLSIAVGLDDDHDGELDSEEVDKTSVVCNGADGQPGTNGTNGTNGTDGTDGTNGTNGTDGKNALIKLVPEPAGSNCYNGGTKIIVGHDLNSNGNLDANEIEDTEYACNGANGHVVTCNDNDICTNEGVNANGTCTMTDIANCCHYTSTSNSDDLECAANEVCGDNNRCKPLVCPAAPDACHYYSAPSNHSCGVLTTRSACCLNNSQCSGSQVCSADNQCVNVTSCDDADICTTDTRNSAGTCVNSDIANCCHNNGECGAGKVCNSNYRCELVTPTCHTFTVASGWQFQGTVGEPGVGGWPDGEWVSCVDDPTSEVCKTLTVCNGQNALFNVQSVPAKERAWSIKGQWNGTNWCGSPDVDESMFVGTKPSSLSACQVVCGPDGYLDWFCQF